MHISKKYIALYSAIRSSYNERKILYQRMMLVTVVIIVFFYFIFLQPAKGFVTNTVISIHRGDTAQKISVTLANKKIIENPLLFKIIVRVAGGVSGVKAGIYRFNKPIGLLPVVYKLLSGELGIVPVNMVFPEGITSFRIGKSLSAKFPNISSDNFNKSAVKHEGYLFPDTYTFMPDVNTKTVVTTMLNNFNTRIASITPEIKMSGRSLKSIVIMASLLEREARTLEQKRLISGILWNRLKIGMPLQVDAVFGYIFNKPTFSPSLKDLKVDSPYNTYTHRGLPPGPISNPGLDSLLAAATPTKTGYLYYITDRAGKMHYSKTLYGHNRNVRRYLR